MLTHQVTRLELLRHTQSFSHTVNIWLVIASPAPAMASLADRLWCLLPGVLMLVLINCLLDNKFLEGRDPMTQTTTVLFPASGPVPGK